MQTVREHLLSRHLRVDNYSVAIDEDECVVTFFLYNLAGQIVGFQQYRPNASKDRKNDEEKGRYYTYTGGHKKDRKITMFGLETIKKDTKYVFVCEGVFDCIRFHNRGHAALATLSNDPKHLKPLFYLLKQKYILIAICDNDDAGKRLAKFCDLSFSTPGTKDCGDMTEEEFAKFLNEVTRCLTSTAN